MRLLQAAWSSSTPDDFVFSVVEECAPEDRTSREHYWITLLKPVFNLIKDPTRAASSDPVVAAMISEANKAYHASPEGKAAHAEVMRDAMKAGTHPAAVKAARTHCKNGHEFTPENTYLSNNGRLCRACSRDYEHATYISTRRADFRTHCRHGHEWTPENTRVWRGKKFCRACDRSRGKTAQVIAPTGPRKTHCDLGHELVGENLYEYRNARGQLFRHCKQCFRERKRRWRAKSKE